MQEFSSISVSSYEAGSLAERLTEQSRDGWHVVAIVPTGSTVTAYLRREASGAAGVPADEPSTAEPTITPAPAPEPAPEPAESEREPMTGATTGAIIPEPAAEPASAGEPAAAAINPTTAAAENPTTDTAAAGAGAAPAGWYADPSGRFELRYWDGGQWTEHVSRAGQQYTDPPVA